MTKPADQAFFTRPAFALLWAFVFTIPLAKVPELPFVDTASKVVGILAMIAGCLAIVESREIRFPGPVLGALGAFILWSAFTLCWSVAPDLTIQRSLVYLQLFVMALLIWQSCKEEKAILRLLDAFVLGSIFPALATLKTGLPGQVALYQRSGGSRFDPSELAVLLALSLPVSYYLALRDSTGLRAVLYRVNTGVTFAAVLLTGCWGAIFAAAAGLLIAFCTMAKLSANKRGGLIVLVLLLSCPFSFLLPAETLQHFGQTGSANVTAFFNDILHAAQQTPLGGLGAGTGTVSGPAHAAGNSYLSALVETGIIGFGCFLAMLGISLFSAERLPGVTRSFWLTLLAVWAIGVCSLGWESSRPAWLLLGLLAAHCASLKPQGVTEAQRNHEQKVYIAGGSEAWS